MKKIAFFLAMCVGLGSLTACMPSQGQRKEEPAGLTETMIELSGGHMLEDNDGMPVPDTDYLPLPSFGTLEPRSVFNVNWRTTEGEYMAGTAFVAQIEESDQPLLLTACHYFSSDEVEVDEKNLSSYVQGGDLYDIFDSNVETIYGTVSGVLPLPDAASISETGKAGKDLAAFYVEKGDNVKSFSLAEEPCQSGDVIYLAAYINPDDTLYYYDDCLYPCVVISDDGEELEYVLSDEFGTQGASGAPLLNDKGEVVGIHIGSDGSHRYGHSAQSMKAQLKNAMEN